MNSWNTTADQDYETAESNTEDVIEDSTQYDEIDAPPVSTQKRRGRRAGAGADRLTRAQVLSVLETHDEVKSASLESLTILRTVLRDADADDQTLTSLILTADRSDNPLATLAELQDSLASNPFEAIAIITGMQPTRRNRAFSALQAAINGSAALSKKDVEAATAFGTALTELTDAHKFALDEAHGLLGK